MLLRRFPWKFSDPNTDPGFKAFVETNLPLKPTFKSAERLHSQPDIFSANVLRRSESVTTLHDGGSDSILPLLPYETRPALRRMLFVAPAARCTLTDLLKGRGKTSGVLYGCHVGAARYRPAPEDGISMRAFTAGHCIDHDVAEEDDGDEWLKRIEP